MASMCSCTCRTTPSPCVFCPTNTTNGNWLWRLQSSWNSLAHQIAVSRSVYLSTRCSTRCAAENAPPLV
ncbi:Uncharacterised protein [Bordetella pertussis]|nr:Uncharacterised protein [Bordetella pertussis]